MENITYQIRFLILNDENEVLKNFILTEREYDTREEACEAAQTICCVLLNHCGWNVFYRVVRPAITDDNEICYHEMTADGSIVSDDELHEEEENEDEDEEEYEGEEENDSYNELTDEEIRAILRYAPNFIRKKYEDE